MSWLSNRFVHSVRLQHLEKKVYVNHGEMPSEFMQLKEKVTAFKDKLEVGSLFVYWQDPCLWLGITLLIRYTVTVEES